MLIVGGLAWATALTSTGVASFAVLPEWVRARGMGLYMLVLSGSVALGSAVWGALANANLTTAHLIAAGTMVLSLVSAMRWRLGNAHGLDLRLVPSDDPRVSVVPHPTDGPVRLGSPGPALFRQTRVGTGYYLPTVYTSVFACTLLSGIHYVFFVSKLLNEDRR